MPDGNEGNAAVLTREFVPQEYHGEEYVKPWLDKPWDKALGAEVFKKLVNAEQLIGKRPAIPDPKTAKPEELEKFFESYRPEKADDYEIPLTDGRPAPDADFIKAIRTAFHEGRISKGQASKFLAKMTEFQVGLEKKVAQEQARKAQEFDALAKTMLGDKNKEKMERVRAVIKDLAPQGAKLNLDKIDDPHVVVMAAVIDAVLSKYVPAADLAGLGKPPAGGGAGDKNTIQAKNSEMQTLMKSDAYKKWDHTDHDATLARIRALAGEIADLQK